MHKGLFRCGCLLMMSGLLMLMATCTLALVVA